MEQRAALTLLARTILTTYPRAATAVFRWDGQNRELIADSVIDEGGAEIWSAQAAPADTAIDYTIDRVFLVAAHAITISPGATEFRYELGDDRAQLAAEAAERGVTAGYTTRNSATYDDDRLSGRELRELRWEMREPRSNRRGGW